MPEVEASTGPPWPDGTFVVDLDRLEPVEAADLEALEHHPRPVLASVSGRCEGQRLAVAVCVHLLVAAPGATFGNAGAWWDLVLRGGSGIAGKKVMTYLAASGRVVDARLAARWGLVSRVAGDPLATAADLATLLTSRPTAASRAILRSASRDNAADFA